MHDSLIARGLAAGLVVAATLSWTGPAAASHTVFSYEVERFETDGNLAGPSDGVVDFIDEFDDDSPGPWAVQFGSAVERDGALVLVNPGAHFPSPDGENLDLSIVASVSPPLLPRDGFGDFTAISYWRGPVPLPSQHYHFSLFTLIDGGPVGFNETFGIGIRQTSTGLEIEQHLTEIDLGSRTFRNVSIEFVAISGDDVTGQIAFRIDFDDDTNLASSSFSLDGGATWQQPFSSGEIFVGRDFALFILSADPSFAGSPATTTTLRPGATSTTTTTTTLPTGNRPTTTTLIETVDRSLDHLAGVLPEPAALRGSARRTARSLVRYERRARKRIERGQDRTGNRQRRQYVKARRELWRLLRTARRADRKGTLGVPLETVEDAVAAVLDRL